jgi:photosystem II stability/assembly factor-like uncharacterized protein
MKKIICTTTLALMFSSALFAQDWVKMMRDPNVNVHDVQKAFEQWYATHKHNTTGNESVKNREADEEGSELFRRWEHFMVPRTYPSGIRPNQMAITNAYNQYLKSAKASNAVNRTMGTANWVYVGNTTVPTSTGSNGTGDGRINRVEFLPGNSNTIFACSPAGGVWKTTNGGASWSTTTDNALTSLGTADIAVNPLNTSIMYLATGDNDGMPAPLTPTALGIMRSADGGTTWTSTGLSTTLQTTGPMYNSSNHVIFCPTDTGMLYAAMYNGLYYTRNDGATWTQSISNDYIMQVAFEPHHASRVYASSASGYFYRSTDSGHTFTQITSGLPTAASGIGRAAIAVSAADSNIVYVLISDANGGSYGAFYGLYRSIDRGQTFTQQSSTPNILGWANDGSDASGQGFYDLTIAVSPTNADSVYVGGPNLWQSSDGGVTWSFNNNFSNSVHVDIHDIKFFPGSSNSFLLACDGGIYKTTDAGTTWTDISNNLEIAEQYSIGLSATNPNLFITGWQDNNVNIAGSPWICTYSGDGMTCFIDYSNNSNMYSEAEYASFAASTDGGNSWNSIGSGITEFGSWNTPWLQDPQNSSTLFAGLDNIWKSTDQGNTWSQISTWGVNNVVALAVAPSDDNYIYATDGASMRLTTDGGNSWSNITGLLPVASASISNITVDRYNSSHVWVTFSGWVAAAKVYESTNAGSSWTNISTGLPNLPVNCIAVQPGTDGIYVGTDIGVYYQDNTTSGWVPYNTGLPNVEVFDLKLYQDNSLLAATFGRGTWQTPTYSSVSTSTNNLPVDNNSVKVYPNPTTGNVQLVFDGPAGLYQINVVNILGQTVYTNNINSTGHYNGNVDLSGNQEGMYIITITGANTKIEKKVALY